MGLFSAPKWDVDEHSENLAKNVFGGKIASKKFARNKVKKELKKSNGQLKTSQSDKIEIKTKSIGGLKKTFKPKEKKKSPVKIPEAPVAIAAPLNGNNDPMSKSQRRKRQKLLKKQQQLSKTPVADAGTSSSNAASISPKKGKKKKNKHNASDKSFVDSRSKMEKLFEVEKKRKRVKKIKEAQNDKPSLPVGVQTFVPSVSPPVAGLDKNAKKKLKKELKKEKKAKALALAKVKLNTQEVVLNKKKKMKMLKIARKVSQNELTKEHSPEEAKGTANPSFDTSVADSVCSNGEGVSSKKKSRKKKEKRVSTDSVDGNFVSTFKKYKLGSKIKTKNLLPSNSLSEMVSDKIPKKKLSVSKLLKKAQVLDSSLTLKAQKKGKKAPVLDSNISYDVKTTRKLEREAALEGFGSQSPKNKKGKQGPTSLREKMVEQLKSARFRWLNEQLYCSNSWDALKYFKEDPDAYEAYHSGYRNQVAQWPVNPVEVIIKAISSLPRESVVADFGCGDAHLAASLPDRKVHSLDLVASKPGVVACDMAHTPLLMESVDVAVFCLSLMGTNLNDFILEANRVLKTGGMLYIAEVESRFEDVDNFTSAMVHFGFSLKKKDISHQMFIFMDFKKTKKVTKSGKMPDLTLEPCIYKRR